MSISSDLVVRRFFDALLTPMDDFDLFFLSFRDGELATQGSVSFLVDVRDAMSFPQPSSTATLPRSRDGVAVKGACLRLSGLGRAHSAFLRTSMACVSTEADVTGRVG
jgi:hypothetical protein